jgi:hypothetical protein
MSAARSVDVATARDMAGREIFGEDWIERMSPAEEKLITDYCPDFAALPVGETFRAGIIEPCPTALRDRLHDAIGRCIRMNAQRTTAADWLMRHAPPAQFGSYDAGALEAAIAKIEQQPAAKPGRGRRSDLADRVERDVRAQLRSGTMKIEELTTMKLEAIGDLFGCGKNTAAVVKSRILASPN